MNPKPAAEQPAASHRLRTTMRWLAVCGLVLLVTLWGSGGLDWIICRRIESLIDARRYESAESLVGWLRWEGCRRAELAFWEGRLLRKQTHAAKSLAQLLAAQQAGYDAERVRRELILLHAQSGNLGPVRKDLEFMLTDPRRDGAEICEAFVNGAMIDGQFDLALTIIAAWQEEFPSDPRPNYTRGRLFEHRLNTAAAEQEYRLAVQRDESHWPSRYALGRLLLGQKKAAEALIQFQAAAHLHDNAAPQLQMAKCLRALGRTDEARSLLLELVKYSQQDIARSFVRVAEPESGLPVELELGLLESSLQNWSAALPWLEQVLRDDDQILEARYALAVTLRSLGRQDDAQREFATVQSMREAIAEADRLVDAVSKSSEPCVDERFRIGELFMKNESRRRGEFWLRDALQRDPHYVPAHRLLAEYYRERAIRDPAYAELAQRHQQAAAPVPDAGAIPPSSETGIP